MAILGPFINAEILNIDPNKTDPRNNFLDVGSEGHILGTDDIGRDQLARLLDAARVSLGIGFFGALFSFAIGMVFGTMAGYLGGLADDVMNWVVTTVDSIPALYLLILFAAIFSPSPEALILVVSIVGWTGTYRLVRAQTFSVREMDYVLAAQAVGAKPTRIMFSHIMPNLISIAIVSLAFGVGGLILTESALSFLGLGVQPPHATWGNMLVKSQQFFKHGGHLVIFPGLCIFVTVLCLYIIGDGIRDAFDPTLND
jgi:peptide/nickel transport system permease protein